MFRRDCCLPSPRDRWITAFVLGTFFVLSILLTLKVMPAHRSEGMLWSATLFAFLLWPAMSHVGIVDKQGYPPLTIAGGALVLALLLVAFFVVQSPSLAIVLVVPLNYFLLARDVRQHYLAMGASVLVDRRARRSFQRYGRLPRGVSPLPRCAAFFDAIVSYCTYGLEPEDVPPSPGGHAGWRLCRVVITIASGMLGTLVFLQPNLLSDEFYGEDPFCPVLLSRLWLLLNPAAAVPHFLLLSFLLSDSILGPVYALRRRAAAANPTTTARPQ